MEILLLLMLEWMVWMMLFIMSICIILFIIICWIFCFGLMRVLLSFLVFFRENVVMFLLGGWFWIILFGCVIIFWFLFGGSFRLFMVCLSIMNCNVLVFFMFNYGFLFIICWLVVLKSRSSWLSLLSFFWVMRWLKMCLRCFLELILKVWRESFVFMLKGSGLVIFVFFMRVRYWRLFWLRLVRWRFLFGWLSCVLWGGLLILILCV